MAATAKLRVPQPQAVATDAAFEFFWEGCSIEEPDDTVITVLVKDGDTLVIVPKSGAEESTRSPSTRQAEREVATRPVITSQQPHAIRVEEHAATAPPVTLSDAPPAWAQQDKASMPFEAARQPQRASRPVSRSNSYMATPFRDSQENVDPTNSRNSKEDRADDPGSTATDRRCSCKHSRCVKLYCVCWSGGVQCNTMCLCQDCFNIPENRVFLQAEQARCKSRNPLAFSQKVEQGRDGEVLHKVGCRCRKSHCVKKYCECFDGGVRCSPQCRCVECQNKPEGSEEDRLASLASAAHLATFGCLNDNMLSPTTAAAVAPYSHSLQAHQQQQQHRAQGSTSPQMPVTGTKVTTGFGFGPASCKLEAINAGVAAGMAQRKADGRVVGWNPGVPSRLVAKRRRTSSTSGGSRTVSMCSQDYSLHTVPQAYEDGDAAFSRARRDSEQGDALPNGSMREGLPCSNSVISPRANPPSEQHEHHHHHQQRQRVSDGGQPPDGPPAASGQFSPEEIRTYWTRPIPGPGFPTPVRPHPHGLPCPTAGFPQPTYPKALPPASVPPPSSGRRISGGFLLQHLQQQQQENPQQGPGSGAMWQQQQHQQHMEAMLHHQQQQAAMMAMATTDPSLHLYAGYPEQYRTAQWVHHPPNPDQGRDLPAGQLNDYRMAGPGPTARASQQAWEPGPGSERGQGSWREPGNDAGLRNWPGGEEHGPVGTWKD